MLSKEVYINMQAVNQKSRRKPGFFALIMLLLCQRNGVFR